MLGMTNYDMQSKGGRARAQKLGEERRKEIARLGASARWAGHVKGERVPRGPREKAGDKLKRLANEWHAQAQENGWERHTPTIRALVGYLVEHW